MDPKKPDQMPSGQVEQENYEPGGIDQENTQSETGPELQMSFTVGKQGSVEEIGMVQTDCTDEPGGGSME
jgi:hypothetical protein